MTEPYFDIFLSYSSKDREWVVNLASQLAARGVRVWRDEDQLKAGDEFPEMLVKGIQESKTVGLVISPDSVQSDWVRFEFKKAREQSDKKVIIPIIYRPVDDSTLGLDWTHHLDFSNHAMYNQNVNKLVWPGITGKRIVVYPLPFGEFQTPNPSPSRVAWERLFHAGDKLGITFERYFARVYRMGENVEGMMQRGNRLVVVANIFDKEKYWGIENPPYDYIDFMYRLREQTQNTPQKVIFLLYTPFEEWTSVHWKSTIEPTLSPEVRNFLGKCFKLDASIADDGMFESQLLSSWKAVQQELMKTERIVG